ncbi:MAG TPA: isopentenyl-diphosphate Delta-isomerase [Chitinophagaceae bacterium]|nr:isopentenyl-diphosphate Delta-isomerase [Chitinophagaceae bacterium]
MDNEVILVNGEDVATGTMEKLQAHRLGLLHRAFSIFIFNSQGHLLMQKRAAGKYHSAGKWSNTCCSHPLPGEDVFDAAERRLAEEMGLHCKLHFVFKFTYFAHVSEDLAEHEIDHVFFGFCDSKPLLNPAEVSFFKYMPMETLRVDVERQPAMYTKWLNICFNRVYSLYKLFLL